MVVAGGGLLNINVDSGCDGKGQTGKLPHLKAFCCERFRSFSLRCLWIYLGSLNGYPAGVY